MKNVGTGAEATVVSGSDGGFTIPSLTGGTYSVTVSLMGFKTAVLNSVSLQAAVPANVRVVLAVGAVEENVTVVGDSALVVQTQSPSIATNLTGNQITSLPLTSRNALDSLTSLPGFSTSGTARNSSVSGLPRSSINITLDGMSIQDNYLKTTDGYFARLTPLLDSVEEVTVTTAGNTADATGQGSVQVRFVTKMGTNSWTGTAYEYLRHDGLNANTWFRNRDLPPDPATGQAPKDKLQTVQPGRRAGRTDPEEQGVLLLQLRRAEVAGGEHAPARHPLARSVGRHLQLQRRRNHAAGEPAAARGRERPARDDRSGDGEAVRRHSGVDEAERQRVTAVEPSRSAVHVVDADAELQSVADLPRRLRADAEASVDRIDELSPHQFDARHDQQRAAAVPGIRDHWQPAVDTVDDVGVSCVRPSRRIS